MNDYAKRLNQMKIYLPNQFKLSYVNFIISQAMREDRSPISEEYDFDFEILNFIEPAGITALCNVLEYLSKRDSKISFIVNKSNANYNYAVKFLDDANFLSFSSIKIISKFNNQKYNSDVRKVTS